MVEFTRSELTPEQQAERDRRYTAECLFHGYQVPHLGRHQVAMLATMHRLSVLAYHGRSPVYARTYVGRRTLASLERRGLVERAARGIALGEDVWQLTELGMIYGQVVKEHGVKGEQPAWRRS